MRAVYRFYHDAEDNVMRSAETNIMISNPLEITQIVNSLEAEIKRLTDELAVTKRELLLVKEENLNNVLNSSMQIEELEAALKVGVISYLIAECAATQDMAQAATTITDWDREELRQRWIDEARKESETTAGK